MIKSLPTSAAYARWLALLRIVVGAAWIAHALPKFLESDAFMPPKGFIVSFVSNAAAHGSNVFRPFFANVVLPNIALFAELVRLGEMVAGVLLVLGLFTRFGGLLGMYLTLNYAAAKGPLLSSQTLAGSDFAMFVLSGINFVLPTGRALGIDAILARRRARPQTVRAEFVPEPPLITPPPPSPTPPPTPAPPPGPSTSS